ncbi:Uma2 family endonuclease [Dolichospermum circinale CS-1225]|uniref:Uma2 family endonuclease n=1 Tax=Dolichospermum circinale TaxID=109265 RepID=UPI000426E5A4|nr:Uma2 family endonuclease [Dolichospermum circinale]MDB9467155.1 Uma2 family endonuclease [Dolichospermum circinale CS-539/09]MDB9472886.1 Uma2 family endonuclease [Dolichospermum circinale CS-539]MDB9520802.1 Uma2 family endonuclease [Dolichospermum circinale CS-1225]
METLTLNIPPAVNLTDEQFYQLCIANEPCQLELTQTGELIIMPPTGGESGIRNSDINIELGLWNRQTKLGKVFDSSTEFKLPSGAYRCPDAAWVKLARWDALSKEEKKRFPPLCPDFVVELRSETDSLEKLRTKMREYENNGALLGWLIDPQTPLVEIYRYGKDVEVLNFDVDNPPRLSGEDILPGFILDLQIILNP